MASQKMSAKNKSSNKARQVVFKFRLYIAGETANCVDAYNNLMKICAEHISVNYKVEVVDLIKLPHLAKEDNIIAIPMVVRIDSKPVRKVIGNLSNTEEVLNNLGIN